MKHGKKMAALLAAVVLTLSFVTVSYAGTWIYDGPENWKWWYREDDGSWPANEWKWIDGYWYHFGEGGYLNVGTWKIDGKYYTFMNTADGDTGKMVTSGTWDYGYISGDGSYAYYVPAFDTSEYFKKNPYHQSEPLSSFPSLDLWDRNKTPYQKVSTISDGWYYDIFCDLVDQTRYVNESFGGRQHFRVEANQKVTRQYALPDNWKEICPVPFINQLVSWGVGYENEVILTEDLFWNWEWSINENVLTVTFWYGGSFGDAE